MRFRPVCCPKTISATPPAACCYFLFSPTPDGDFFCVNGRRETGKSDAVADAFARLQSVVGRVHIDFFNRQTTYTPGCPPLHGQSPAHAVYASASALECTHFRSVFTSTSVGWTCVQSSVVDMLMSCMEADTDAESLPPSWTMAVADELEWSEVR